jgi:protein TonB
MISFLISAAFHAIVVSVVVIVPLFFFNVLPQGELLTFLFAPPPPPPVPPVPAPPVHPVRNQGPIRVRAGELPPKELPKGIPPPTDEPPVVEEIVTPEFLRNMNPIHAGPVGSASGVEGLIRMDDVPVLPPPPPPPKKEPLLVIGTFMGSKLIRRVEPDYPHIARRARISGVVILRVQVTEEGIVSDVRVLSGHPLLNQAALDAVSQWRYSPTLLNGEPVPITGTVTVIFKLN